MHGPEDQPNITPGRHAVLNNHAKALASGNPKRQQAAVIRLGKMKLNTHEQSHLLKLQIQHESKIQAEPASNNVRQLKQLPVPLAGGRPDHIARQVKQFKHVKNETNRNSDQLAAMVNPISHENLVNEAEGLTGYHEILHLRNHPIAGGLALASLIPGGGFGHIIEAARGADAAEHAANAARAADEATGVRKLLAERKATRLAKRVARRGAPRTAEQANTHVLGAAKKAKQQGFGRMLPKVPDLKPGEVTPATGGEAGRIVRQGLNPDHKGLGTYEKVGAKLDNPGLAALRKQQDELRHVELSRRAGAIEEASAGKSGLARHIAAKSALEGKLPAGYFHGFDALTPEFRDQAINHIYEHPHFLPFEKVHAVDALDTAIAGHVPTKGEQKLLERAFGREKASGVMAELKRGGIRDTIANIANIPRAIMASGDLSAPFRQGLVVMASHPGIFVKGFVPMLKAAGSEKYYQASMAALHAMPEFSLMEKAKVPFTEIGDTVKGVENVNKREEQFATNWAERIPGLGRIIRGSDRAYTLFLNTIRAKVFTHLVHQAAENGYHLEGPRGEKLLKDIGKFVGSATGRGDLGRFAEHTAFLNSAFFSPRLMASRFNFMNPVYYIRMEPFARQQALRAALRLSGTLSMVLWMAKMGGAEVNLDPRNADFAKIRIGDTRIDMAGGFAQPIRLLWQIRTGQVISSTSGKVENLSGSGFGRNRLDVVGQFFENKLAPVPSTVVGALKGGLFGQKYDLKSQAAQRMIPLLWQDLWQIQHATGPGGAVGYGIPDLFGVGVQNYSAKPPKSSGSGGSFGGYGGSGSSGSFGGYGGGSGSSSFGGYGP